MIRILCMFLLISIIVFPSISFSAEPPKVRIAVFNYGTLNIETRLQYDRSECLINNSTGDPSLALLDRKELETFLA